MLETFNLDLQIIGPIRLPRKNRNYTVNRSHHVNKKSRDQFKLTTYSSLWIIKTTIDPNLSQKVQKDMEEKFQINFFKVLSDLKKNHSINMNIS